MEEGILAYEQLVYLGARKKDIHILGLLCEGPTPIAQG